MTIKKEIPRWKLKVLRQEERNGMKRPGRETTVTMERGEERITNGNQKKQEAEKERLNRKSGQIN